MPVLDCPPPVLAEGRPGVARPEPFARAVRAAKTPTACCLIAVSSTDPALDASAPRLERRRHRGWRVAWRVAFATLFAAWSLLLLAWLTLQWGIVPRVGQWKPQIEQRASAALGVPVTIGAIRVQSSGWMPLIELDDVVLAPRHAAAPAAGEALRLPNAGSGEALRLPRVSATLSARSLLGWQLRFEQLHVDGAALEVRRDSAGRLFVAGIELRAGPADDDSAGTDWLLAQREIAVRNGSLRWIDEQRGAPPLELSAVDLVLRNGLAGHELRLDATPPPQVGQRFTLRGEFRQPLLAQRSDWRRWSGTAFAELPQADAAALRPWLSALPVDVAEGEGALRAWVEVDAGEVKSAQADLALRQVLLRFPGRTTQALPLQRLQGRISAAREGRMLRFAAEQLAFASGSVDWPTTRVNLMLREHEPTRRSEPAASSASSAAPAFDGGEFTADRLDIGALATLAAHLPLGEAVNQLLTDLAPSGQVNNLNARWDGPLDAPRTYQIKAQASALSIAAKPAAEANRLGRPGWRNATLDIDANEGGGRALLALNKGALIFPGLFERPEVAFDTFGTKLAWRITPQAAGAPSALEVTATDTQFANADAQGQLAKAVWHSGPGTGFARAGRLPGQLDLSAQLSHGRAAAVARYLPLGIPDAARRYVEQAVRDGRVASATVTVKGDLFDFPFVPYTLPGAAQPVVPNGEFKVAARAEDVELVYVPGQGAEASSWPAFSRVSGELVFDRNTMDIRNAQARLWGVDLTKVNGNIRDLRKPVLKIDGEARGPAADLLRYVNSSPVGGWTSNALRGATASGAAELKLALELPIAELERSTVQGTVQLAGNDVRLTRETPLLAAAKARISFSQKGFSVAGATARVMGGEATFDGGTQQDGGLRFNGQGVATAEALRSASELGALSRLAASASGQTPYRLTLGFVRGRSEFTLTSPLTGLALDLPAPLKKAAEISWPLRVETRIAADGPLRDSLRVELGDVLSAQYQRDLTRDDGAPVVMRGAIGVLEPAPPLPERGVQAVLALAAVDGDAWQAAAGHAPSNGTTATPALSAAARIGSDNGGYLPRVVALRAQSIVSSGRRLNNIVLGVSQDAADGAWRGNIDAEQLAGYVEYRASADAAHAGRVYARLSRLALPPAEASSVETLLAEAPTNVPALDIVIDNFELRGKKLGRIELEGVNRGPREWRLNKLALTNPEAQLSGSGQWQAGASPRMVMDFKLDLTDSGAFMDRLGFAGTLRGGKGRVGGQVSWAGSPLAFHLPSLDGKLNIALDNGQFLKAGPGAARLFSVLSLQALPRRLALDFRDVFQEGFAFDNVTGDVIIDDGVASTRNLRLRGVQAAVLMEGSADLQRETQDLRVIVVPEINAGTASLAYAAINPAIGLGTFVAQLFLRRPLMAASTREFTVQGSWAEPKVERVERKLDAPLPDFDTPSAASAPKPPS
jgi:uncharacterized protein (TIGR02099 family)